MLHDHGPKCVTAPCIDFDNKADPYIDILNNQNTLHIDLNKLITL